MSYMGKVDVKASDIKRFSVTGSTSATHALSWTAPSEQALIITINGVKQHDGSYTISGTPTTITLSSALVATDEMEVIGINDIGQTNTVAQDSIVTNMIRDDAVTTAKIADDQITSAKLANAINITSGNSLTIDSGATITNSGTASGFGKVLQVVQGTYSTQTSTTSNSWTSTGLTASITPSSTSNKILIMASMGAVYTSAATIQGAFKIFRDSTSLSGSQLSQVYGNNSSIEGNEYIQYLDSPSSTSSITYDIRFLEYGSGTIYVNLNNSTSVIILMEIAG